MANDIGRAMARLKHRDIRTRRRAVRTLFEHDDAAVLEAFQPLLDDQDSWFVSKALDAYRMWGVTAGSEAISVLLRHSNLDVRRAGANLLTPLGVDGKELAIEALNDEDGVVQRKAAKALLRFDEATAAERLVRHPNDAVRITGMNHSALPEEALRSGLEDRNDGVRQAALDGVFKREIQVNMDALMPFLDAGLQTVNILIWVAKHEPNHLGDLTARIKPKDMKALSDHLRSEVQTSDEPLMQHLIEGGLLEPVARWVISQGASEDDLRWDLINDERLHVIERSKLLERLIGRAHEPSVMERTQALLSTTGDELLKVACENLSTAASEVNP
jgi:hypothetical protein